MKRKKNRGNRHDDNRKPEFHVSLETWQKFQRFVNVEEQIDEALGELDEAYNAHIAYLGEEFSGCSPPTEEMDDVLRRFTTLLRAVHCPVEEKPRPKKRRHKGSGYVIYQSTTSASCVPVKKKDKHEGKKPQVATIIIEDISDGYL